MKQNILKAAIVGISLVATGQAAFAGVATDEAAKLKSSLTPLGGEKAGNKDGSIPEWTGGLKSATGNKVGDVPENPFPGDKPVVQINAKNMAQYAEKLSDGVKALMSKYPETFRIDVYPTHRTAIAADRVYENTFKNATRCKVTASGNSVENCFGGIPFPIPKTGSEVFWNANLRVEPESIEYKFRNFVGTADGARTMATRNEMWLNYPYYFKDGTPESWSKTHTMMRFTTIAPPFKAGEQLVVNDGVDESDPRQAWQYLVGQRRVRRAPTVAYDTPDFVSSGANYFDEVNGFVGPINRYEYKLVGKKELYVPYNENAFVTSKIDDVFVKNHLNPDKVRWELHRVWVVEASVAQGKRHAVPKRKFYIDEDSWVILMADGYDAEGKLWRTLHTLPFAVPAIPAISIKPSVVYNLQANTYSAIQFINEEQYRVVPRKPDSFFSGEAMAASSAR
jgi:hypothetical protein